MADYRTKARIRILLMLLVLVVFEATIFDTLPVDAPDVFVILLYVGIQFGMAVWVYNDAKKRGAENPIHWYYAIALPVIGLFGLLVYLKARRATDERTAT
jgi:hypothetical protein